VRTAAFHLGPACTEVPVVPFEDFDHVATGPILLALQLLYDLRARGFGAREMRVRILDADGDHLMDRGKITGAKPSPFRAWKNSA